MLVRVWRKWNPCALLIGRWISSTTVGNRVDFPHESRTTIWSVLPCGSTVKESICSEGDAGSTCSLGRAWITHSSILAWKIPWTKEPGRLWSMGWQWSRHDWSVWALCDPLLGIYPTEINSILKKQLYSHIYCSIIHNCCDLRPFTKLESGLQIK